MYCLDHCNVFKQVPKNGSQATCLHLPTKQCFTNDLLAENLDLVKYLVSQVMMSDEDRLNELRKYYRCEDWRLSQGGQRVQIIKRTG